MLRGLMKTGIARGIHCTGVDKVIGRVCANRRPLVIGYHRVVEDFRTTSARSMPAMLVSSRTLERQLDWVGRRFAFITLDELTSRLGEGRGFDKPVAAITFDDGYSDMYHHAFPLLKRKGIPAAVFVASDLVGTSHLQIHDELYLLLSGTFSAWPSLRQCLLQHLLDLGMPPAVVEKVRGAGSDPFRATRVLLEALPQDKIRCVVATLEAEVEIPECARGEHHSLNWEMLSEMHRMGVTVGSHTRTHAVLTNETWQKVRDETEGSRQVVERRLGISVRHFAYPDGRFNAATVRAVNAAGYRGAYTTCRHRDPDHPLLSIPRRLFWERCCLDAFGHFSPAVMSCQSQGIFDFVNGCRQDHWTTTVLGGLVVGPSGQISAGRPGG